MPRQCTNGKFFASAEAKTVEGSSGTALWDNVADLRILPGMGKIVFPRVAPDGAPVESKPHHNDATRYRG